MKKLIPVNVVGIVDNHPDDWMIRADNTRTPRNWIHVLPCWWMNHSLNMAHTAASTVYQRLPAMQIYNRIRGFRNDD